MSSRSSFPTEVYSTDSQLSPSDSVWEAIAKPKPSLRESGKRKRQEVDKHPIVKKQRVTPVNIIYVWDLVVISPVIIFCVYSDVHNVKVVQ